jgi:hypothetical protein
MTICNDGELANDDWPILVVSLSDVGQHPEPVFLLLRTILGLSPAAAKSMLAATPFEIGRGSRLEIEDLIPRFEKAGATVVVRQNEN